MLPEYGVVIGQFQGYTREQGQWLHVDLNINVNSVQYQAAVDVNEPNGQFQYQIFSNLDHSLFSTVSSMPDGYHRLASTPSSGAIDYARSPILQQPLGCLGLLWGAIDFLFGANLQTWTNVTGDAAGNALVALVQSSTRLFAFGAPYTNGNGVHDVHCNQGDPPNTGNPPGQFQKLDGIWQDGCVFALMNDGTLAAYLGKFSSQTLNTNSAGLPN